MGFTAGLRAFGGVRLIGCLPTRRCLAISTIRWLPAPRTRGPRGPDVFVEAERARLAIEREVAAERDSEQSAEREREAAAERDADGAGRSHGRAPPVCARVDCEPVADVGSSSDSGTALSCAINR